MKITINWLEEEEACIDGIDWFRNREFKTDREVFESLLSADHFYWANWGIFRLMDCLQKLRYTIFAAEQVIDSFERKYPEDDRLRKAIEVAKEYLKNLSGDNVDASSAFSAAAAYASSAFSAAAAYAYYDVSFAAAAAGKEIQKKIIEFGIELLEEEKQ